jgi:hypothetical protein
VTPNDLMNSSVFKRRMKTNNDGDVVTKCGRLFKTREAATWKARSPMVERLVVGTMSSMKIFGRSLRSENIQSRDSPAIGRNRRHRQLRASAFATTLDIGPIKRLTAQVESVCLFHIHNHGSQQQT